MRPLLPVGVLVGLLGSGAARGERVALVQLPPRGVSVEAAARRCRELALDLARRGQQVIDAERSRDLLYGDGPRTRRIATEQRQLEQLTEEGSRQIVALRLAAAVATLSRAAARLPQLGAHAASPRAMARIHFLQGVALQRLNETTLAREAYERAATLDPDFEPSPTDFAPDITGRFRAARQAAVQAKRCALQITTHPPAVQVRLDGRAVGVTPLRLDLLPGEHYLLLQAPAHAAQARVVRACGVPTLDVALSARPALPPVADLATAAPAVLDDARAALGAPALLLVRSSAAQGRESLWYRVCRAGRCDDGTIDLQGSSAASSAALPLARRAPRPHRPWYRSWWLWASAGGVVATSLAIALPLTLRSSETRYVVQGASSALVRW
jgi:tetratricopeptide (TPR) repeat protein